MSSHNVATRSLRVAILPVGAVLVVAALLHGWIARYDYYATTFTDSMDYLFLADFYRAHFHGGGSEAVQEYYRNTRYPPLFSMLLGSLGAGSDQQHLAAVISNATAVLAALAVWLWVRLDTQSRWLATGVAVAMLLLPSFFVLNLSPVSEPLGILLAALVFALLAVPRPTASRILIAGCLAGIAPLARAALLPLSLALIAWLVHSRHRRSAQRAWDLWAAACALTPFVAWSLYRQALGAQQYQDFLEPSDAESTSAGMAEWLSGQFGRLITAWHDLWCAAPTTLSWTLSLTLLALVATGCTMRLIRGKPDAWFVGGYVALILVWPFPNEFRRFLTLVYPFLLLAACTAVAALTRRSESRWSAPAAWGATAALLIALSFPAWSLFAHRAALPVDSELLGEKREPGFFLQPEDAGAIAVAEAFGRSRLLLMESTVVIPDGHCLYATPPQLARLYTRRPVVEYPTGLGSDAAAASALLDRCDYYFFGGWVASAYGLPPAYPSEALAGWTEPVLISKFSDSVGGGTAAALVRRAAIDPGVPAR